MNILILGSGGREHALAWKVSQSKQINDLYIAPGNSGTSLIGKNINLNINNFDDVKKVVIENKIDIVVVGPEEPLVNGIFDYFVKDKELKKTKVIGPSKLGAQLEGSKEFAKEFMQKYNIPTARFKSITIDNIKEGYIFLESLKPPYVLKADGLAGGKGVLIISDLNDAKSSMKSMLAGQFGSASKKVVIEEYLLGIEVSYFVITDGKSYKILPEAKDYKRIGERDKGLNTGGMGAVSPVYFVDNEFKSKVEERIVKPTVEGLKNEKIKYKGFIFIGLMNVKGEPFVIEYNVRLGDPETETILPRIKSDFVDLLKGVANTNLRLKKIEIDERTVSTTVLVSQGYPGDYRKGDEIIIKGKNDNSIIFHSGTTTQNNKLLTNGGRVLSISSFGDNLTKALENTYQTIEQIDYEGKYCRKDIGKDLLISETEDD